MYMVFSCKYKQEEETKEMAKQMQLWISRNPSHFYRWQKETIDKGHNCYLTKIKLQHTFLMKLGTSFNSETLSLEFPTHEFMNENAMPWKREISLVEFWSFE